MVAVLPFSGEHADTEALSVQYNVFFIHSLGQPKVRVPPQRKPIRDSGLQWLPRPTTLLFPFFCCAIPRQGGRCYSRGADCCAKVVVVVDIISLLKIDTDYSRGV